jgi:hypothetical protein
VSASSEENLWGRKRLCASALNITWLSSFPLILVWWKHSIQAPFDLAGARDLVRADSDAAKKKSRRKKRMSFWI